MTARLSEEQTQQFIRDGYLIARGLLAPELVAATREALLAALGIDPGVPATWDGKALSADPAIIALTAGCRTEKVEAVAEQLVGPCFVRGLCHSPYLESRGVSPALMPGYIPVLNFPTPGPRQFQKPDGFHIDGMHLTTLWPEKHFLVVFAYLTDVAPYGGATTVLPGSHRQVFAHWVRTGHPGSTQPPDLEYADPVPLPGQAGDVIFMHYLTVHSGSANHADQIRVGLNTAVMPDPARPYPPKQGAPGPDWTPLDYSLRTDILP
jgi:Phytanoyl-CoA dioxygenase (PhyH)